MTDPAKRPGSNPAGVLGQPIIDPSKLSAFGSQLARATADLEAMRVLAVVPRFTMTWDGRTYTVAVLDVTKSDPFLSRAILLAAQEAGVAAPPKPEGVKP